MNGNPGGDGASVHDQVDELLAAYALAAVDPGEATLVRDHLPTCQECQRTLLRLSEVGALLPLSLETVEPPADLRQRILDQARGGRGINRGAASAAAPPVTGMAQGAARDPRPGTASSSPGVDFARVLPLRRRWAAPPRWVPTAVAASLFLALGGWVIFGHGGGGGQPAPATQAVLVDGSHRAAAHVTYLRDQQVALVSFQGMLAPGSGRTYELWVIPSGGRPLPAGVFAPDPDGTKVVVVNRAINHGDTLAVTEEPLGGRDTPSGRPIITGSL